MSTKAYAILIDPTKTGDRVLNEQLRKMSCDTCGYPQAHDGDLCEKCEAAARERRRQHSDMERSFNIFMFGCADPMHVEHIGWIDPYERRWGHLLDG